MTRWASHSPGLYGFINQVSPGTADETHQLPVDADIQVSLVLNPTQTAWRRSITEEVLKSLLALLFCFFFLEKSYIFHRIFSELVFFSVFA